jgi:hypothetical protein
VLLRRPEGAVFVFERWAAPGEPVEAVAALVDPELTTLRSISSPTCPLLLAVRADGTARGVPIRPYPTTTKDSP